MNRPGNIGAAKNMDTVFADFTDEELEQDFLFDEDDQLVEIVEGFTEEGNTIFEEDEEIFRIAHQIEDENKDKPEEIKKETEKLLGPDNDTDQKIKDIEDVEKEKLDDSQTMDELKKNGESEADKELGLDKLEDEYHSSATVEEAYSKWMHESPYDYDKENEAEGTDDELGKDIDNSLPAEDPKPEEDENYNATADASVKEEYDYDKPDEAEGTDDKFGKKIDNSEPTEDVKPEGDEKYNATNDASIEEAFNKWFNESDEVKVAKCDCGKDDCPICNPKKEDLAPEDAPTEDKAADGERHEESDGETITDADGEGIAPANVDDNTLPKPDEMTPDCSPETDNGDITDDGKKCDTYEEKPAEMTDEEVNEAFDKWFNEEADLELPLDGGETPMLPEDVKKQEEELADAAPESDAEIKTESDEIKPEGTEDTMPEQDATIPEDEGCCGKGSGCQKESTLEETFSKWLHEEDEVEVPTADDVEDAAETEVEDTESELDDDLAAVADDDSEGEDDVELEYDPSDEDLIDIAGGEEVEEKAAF